MDDKFRLEEYKLLRDKSKAILDRVDNLERNLVLFCGAVFTFAVGFRADYKFQSVLLYVLPFAVSLAAWRRYKGMLRYMKEVNNYTMKLEEELGGEKGGWLRYYYALEGNRSDDEFQKYRAVLWKSIIWFNALAALALVGSLLLKLPEPQL